MVCPLQSRPPRLRRQSHSKAAAAMVGAAALTLAFCALARDPPGGHAATYANTSTRVERWNGFMVARPLRCKRCAMAE